MKKILRVYLRHIRKQSDHAKRVHAFSIAGFITILIAVGWLHVRYGFWSTEEVKLYPSDQQYEVRELGSKEVLNTATSAELTSPNTVFTSFVNDLRKRMSEVPLDFSQVVKDKQTFERQEQ